MDIAPFPKTSSNGWTIDPWNSNKKRLALNLKIYPFLNFQTNADTVLSDVYNKILNSTYKLSRGYVGFWWKVLRFNESDCCAYNRKFQ